MTCDTWHLTHDMWHVTSDIWHATHDLWQVGLGGRWSFSHNFSSLALTVFEWRCFEGSVTDLINNKGVCRTAPATPGLLKITCQRQVNHVGAYFLREKNGCTAPLKWLQSLSKARKHSVHGSDYFCWQNVIVAKIFRWHSQIVATYSVAVIFFVLQKVGL